MSVVLTTAERFTPEWWRDVLLKKLEERVTKDDPRGTRLALETYYNYFDGKHNLAFATKRFEEAFGKQLSEVADNWCALPIQAPQERMTIQAFRFKEVTFDKDAWRIWQRNELDALSTVHTESTLTSGYGYALVWADDDQQAVITIEDPRQVIVAYEPGTRKRAAALKRWTDEWTGRTNVTLYLPDALYKWRSIGEGILLPSGLSSWEERNEDGEEWPLLNPLGIVPMVEFTNDPSLLMEGRSEIRRVIPIQDGINKLTADLFIASEFSAFRQRWATGIDIPKDPDTGKPVEPFKSAVDRLWAVASENAQFGEFGATDLKNYVDAIEMLIHHIAAQTRTPRHYFFQSGQAPSGDSIKSAETGLVAKVTGEKFPTFGERWEEVIRLAFRVEGDPRQNELDVETRWADPEYRTEGELTDAVIKKFKAGLIPWEQALEDCGYTAKQIERMRGQRVSEALMTQGADLSTLLRRDSDESAV